MKKGLAFVLAVLFVLLAFTGCGRTESASDADSYETVKIGVLTYNATDSEVLMFRSYLENNLGDAFGVEYFYSNTVASLEDEKEFIDRAREAGCKGVISFMTHDLEAIVDYCGEDMFYALQNMTPTEEAFEAVKNKPQFLGVVSPANEAENEAGADIAAALLGDRVNSSLEWLVFTGGASYGNNMHARRTQGIMDVLTMAGYELTISMDELLTAQEPMLAAEGKDGGKVYICPGYPGVHTENIEKALTMCSADRVASCCTMEAHQKELHDYLKANPGQKVGLVDCFSENMSTGFANGEVDCLVGKYAAMVAPTFVAMMNAIYGDMDLVKENGEAYWLTQDMWYAGDKDTFMELYGESVNVYDNTYCSDELMAAIGVYNSSASHADFVNLIEDRNLAW